MQIKTLKIKQIALALAVSLLGSISAYAADMSALDYNGDLLGKVIPDGSVINAQNELIGHITADGTVVDENNNLIGGVVPQGIAISVNNTVLGKINNDGSVTSTDDSVIGKVLPNGLIVDLNYNVLGSVISPGLVYNDEGNIIGRVSGDGKFYTLEGESAGFVTSTGEVYTTTETNKKATLVGKVISSKMVSSSNGKFLGSISPDGKVMDLKKNFIGNVHANGFIYNAEGLVIGHVVKQGYAFDLEGKYLGAISYNGEVIDKGATIAYSSYGNKIIGKDGKIIGFAINTSATANTLDGKYLGYIIDNGSIAKGREVVGKIGASGNVIDSTGKVIGFINKTGPIFDYTGEVQATAAINGSVVSLNGIEQGYMLKKRAYDYKGKEIGRLLGSKLNYDNSNNFIGLSGITTSLSYQGKAYKISPYGYIFDEAGNINGKNYDLLGVYSPDGQFLANLSGNGKIENIALSDKSKMTNAGYLFDSDNKVLGRIIVKEYATNFKGEALGYINPTNLIIDAQNNIFAKILPDGNVINDTAKENAKIGYADDASLSISINGDYLGINKPNGEVQKGAEVVGNITSNQYVVDNMGALYGKTLSYGVIVSPNCKLLGIVSDNGDARTPQNNYLGMILANNQVINDAEEVIGYLINPKIVNGKQGLVIGIETPTGTVLNYKSQNLGCQDIHGKIRNAQQEIIGQILPNVPVMDFNNKVIGRINFSGQIEDISGAAIGYIDVDGGAHINSGEDIGSLFEYTVAFDNNNTYVGRINDEGKVINENGENIGTVNYDGAVLLNDGQLGYALYDLYIYDNAGNTIGYIAKNGRVYSIMGDVKGSIYKGFCLDKKQNLIGRGARDYYIRDNAQKIIGYLGLDGKVINTRNIEIGQLGNNGEILDAGGTLVATANPLQYYQKEIIEEPEIEPEPEVTENNETDEDVDNEDSEEETEDNEDTEDSELEDEEDAQSANFSQNIIGVALSPNGQYLGQVNENNEVIDRNGNVIARVDENGNIIDENGNKIGEFQGQQAGKPQVANSNWFRDIIKGVTISPYDDTNNISNVGEGGGIGPGGRYNPRRAAILGRLYAERRQSLSGAKINNESDLSVYTGWQEDWGGEANINKTISTLRVDMSNMITSDKPIPAVLARTVISLGKAPITAIVERNIYGEQGRNVIIPAGSRIIGVWDIDERDEEGMGREDGDSGGIKLEMRWQRIIRPDGIAFKLDSSETGDAQGRGGGALGYVDEQLIRKYAMPLFGNVATSALAYMMAANEDATGEVETSKQQAASDARENFIAKMNDILDKIMEEKEQITPVTYIPAGTRVIIYPMADLWLRTTKNVESNDESAKSRDNTKVLLDEDNDQDDIVQKNNRNQNQPTPTNNTENSENGSQSQNNGGKRTNVAMPPPSADGTGGQMPEENKDDMELEF